MFEVMFGIAVPAALGIIVWAFAIDPKIQRVDAKVDANAKLHDQRYGDLKELINTRFDSVDDRMGRIERSMNGHLVKD